MSLNSEILFVISPNFGIIDSWLPILYELKKRNHHGIAAFFARKNLLAQVREGDLLTEFSEMFFESVIWEASSSGWLVASSLKRAAVDNDGTAGGIVRNAQRFCKWLFPSGSTRSIRDGVSALGALLPNVRAVLFDIDSEKLELVRVLQDEIFNNVPWFSLPHGIDLRISHSNKLTTNRYPGRNVPITAYVASDQEIEPYRILHGLEAASIKPVGVPRHTGSWIGEVNRHCATQNCPDLPYIFLASRPKNPKYFPAERKIRALRDIKRLSAELGCSVVVRCHPKEHDNALFMRELGQEFFQKRWFYSTKHPLVLGANALFCITFFSSVAVDMAALGIPAIERFDFTGLEGMSLPLACGPTSIYQKFGLAFGAQNYGELREQASRIMSDREAAKKQVKDAYKALYTTLDNPIGVIADDIERFL
jgi:hypothetical protein